MLVLAQVPVKVEIDYDSPTEWGGYDTKTTYDTIPVEVLTVHFEKNTMRVRYRMFSYGKEKTVTLDIPADPFFSQYTVTSR